MVKMYCSAMQGYSVGRGRGNCQLLLFYERGAPTFSPSRQNRQIGGGDNLFTLIISSPAWEMSLAPPDPKVARSCDIEAYEQLDRQNESLGTPKVPQLTSQRK